MDKIIVGYEWHNFHGDGDLCIGTISGSEGKACGKTREDEIHSDQRKPQWMNDTGQRTYYSNGMMREVNPDKPAFDLLLPKGIKYEDQMLTRFAQLLAKGAKKYAPRNWELGVGLEEYERAKASALRHMMQWLNGEEDEDHAAAVYFNIMQAEYIRTKLEKNEITN